MAEVASSVITSGTTFAQLKAGGLPGLLAKLATANPAIADPATAPTVSATGGGSTGGLLAAGAYFASYTWTNGFGESLAKEVASAFTVSAGNIPTVTIPALPTGAVSANIYLTPVGGATKTETLYATGVAATTVNLATAYVPGLGVTPAKNTTALSGHPALSGVPRNWVNDLYYQFSRTVDNYLNGNPVAFGDALGRVQESAALFHALAEAADEVATLIDANRGTLTNKQNQIGQVVPVRTFP